MLEDEDVRVIKILGDNGSGKTSLIKKLSTYLARREFSKPIINIKKI